MRSSIMCCLLVFLVNCANDRPPAFEASASLQERLDPYIDWALEFRKVPAISLVVFTPDSILYQRATGITNLADPASVDTRTTFEAASLGKTVFAYLVMREVLAGKITLDQPLDSIAELNTGPPGALRKDVTPGKVLAHQAGLPNWRGAFNFSAEEYEHLFSLKDSLQFLATPGQEFHYSGEGYLWLQQVMEQVWQQPTTEFAQQRLFAPLEMDRSSFLLEESLVENAAYGHLGWNEPTDRLQFYVPLAAGTLHSNALDYARFLQYFLREMKNSVELLVMLEPRVVAAEGLDYLVEWGLGVGLLTYQKKKYLFHWGDNRIFKAYYLYDISAEKGLVFFVNCQEGLRLQPELVKRVFGVEVPMWPESYLN